MAGPEQQRQQHGRFFVFAGHGCGFLASAIAGQSLKLSTKKKRKAGRVPIRQFSLSPMPGASKERGGYKFASVSICA
jgi:hypothetical protein